MRFAIIAAGALAASAVVLSGNAARADATPTGVEVGLRAGYGIPLGDAAGGNPSTSLSNVFSGMIPIQIDAGYRFTPNMMVGAFFQYGIASIASGGGTGTFGAACSQSGVSCSGSDMTFGAQFHYHLMPDQTIDPWAGIGVGYELANVSVSQGGQSASLGFSGFQFVNLQVGGDYKVMPNLGVGPFVQFSLGEFSSCSYGGAASSLGSCSIQNTAMHEWLQFGIRGAYDINL
jgi:hypothetical protein